MTEGRRTFLARFGLGAGLLAGGLLGASAASADYTPENPIVYPCPVEEQGVRKPEGNPSLTPVEQPKPKPPSGG